jgi:hypothetical protein
MVRRVRHTQSWVVPRRTLTPESGHSADDRDRLLDELLALSARMEIAHVRLAERASTLDDDRPARRARSQKGRERAK